MTRSHRALLGALACASLTAAPAHAAYTATAVGTTGTFTGNASSDALVFDQSGGLLRNNRFSAGDAGFNSDFDFDSATAGDQTFSATDPAVKIIVNAGGGTDSLTIHTVGGGAPRSAFTFDGQTGNDLVDIDDSTDNAGRA